MSSVYSWSSSARNESGLFPESSDVMKRGGLSVGLSGRCWCPDAGGADSAPVAGDSIHLLCI